MLWVFDDSAVREICYCSLSATFAYMGSAVTHIFTTGVGLVMFFNSLTIRF